MSNQIIRKQYMMAKVVGNFQGTGLLPSATKQNLEDVNCGKLYFSLKFCIFIKYSMPIVQ